MFSIKIIKITDKNYPNIRSSIFHVRLGWEAGETAPSFAATWPEAAGSLSDQRTLYSSRSSFRFFDFQVLAWCSSNTFVLQMHLPCQIIASIRLTYWKSTN